MVVAAVAVAGTAVAVAAAAAVAVATGTDFGEFAWTGGNGENPPFRSPVSGLFRASARSQRACAFF
ncbi:exported hypothetical protein [Verrucomicrobia bacterium]|nr:exported hypothetical protein [Verrucomicrobiota bacterium]